jgi:hypothetical protein
MRAPKLALCAVLALALVVSPSVSLGQADVRAKIRELDSLLLVLRNPDWSHISDSLLATAFRYASPDSHVTRSDSTRALATFIAAARSPDAFTRLRAPYVAMRTQLADFAPLMERLAWDDQTHFEGEDGDTLYSSPNFVRDAAVRAYTVLKPLWLAMTPAVRLSALQREVAASCLDVPGSLGAPCNAMSAALRRFGLHMKDSDSARADIVNFQRSLKRAASAGLPELTLFLLAANDSMLEQSTFHVDVQPHVARTEGDTITMTYVVRVVSPASDRLDEFLVDAPAFIHVDQPYPRNSWRTGIRALPKRTVPVWYNVIRQIGVGQSTPALPVKSRGVLGVVSYWAERVEPMSSAMYDVITDTVTTLDTLIEVHGQRGFTVGVVPFPADLTPSALAKRLAALIDQSCELGWIDTRPTCDELRADANPAPAPLRALLDELAKQRGKRVSEPAYLLLEWNTKFLIARL